MLKRWISNKWNLMGLWLVCWFLLSILFKDDIFTIEERTLSVIIIIGMSLISYLWGMYRGIFIELMKWSHYADLIDKEREKLKTDKDAK